VADRFGRDQWSIQDGRFGSFWPPSYRSAYDLQWMVEDGAVVGLRFTARDGTRFDGRYRAPGDVVPQEPALQPTRPAPASLTS
jgi:CubicO group peptidase (beta-lactamase class C family)